MNAGQHHAPPAGRPDNTQLLRAGCRQLRPAAGSAKLRPERHRRRLTPTPAAGVARGWHHSSGAQSVHRPPAPPSADGGPTRTANLPNSKNHSVFKIRPSAQVRSNGNLCSGPGVASRNRACRTRKSEQTVRSPSVDEARQPCFGFGGS